ncbi:cytochrome P450 [Lentinula edodes]|uniref:cytochrome P450 n=1 Tax=Lentinula edodes TaxID=5353 RepID=UPI001E8CE88B|nr:cytochrome P450 [Lentinula edodes]KAH7870900.1 cytochrome P450 [Lentinula edodes]
MSPFQNFLFLCWSTSLIAMYLFRRFNKNSKSLPPGPLSLPWIGNIKCLFSRPNWITYTEWYRTYESDIVHVNIAGNSIIILNTLEAAMELLEQRSSIYSSRPTLRMLNDLWEWSFISMPYGQKWNAQRKLFVNMFNANNPEHHEPQELKSTRLFLLKLYEKPEDFVHLLRKMGGSTILSVIYGYDVGAVQDSAHTENAEQGADGFMQTFMPGSFLVDYIPWMRYIPSWFPGASFQCRAQVWKEAMEKLLHGPFDEMRNSFEEGLQSCFVSRCMGKLSGDSNIDQEWVIKQTAGSMYLAGTDTTVNTLWSFFLAMTKYPECQKKAQEELDRVVGAKRLPDFDDRNSLPYIQAIVYEVMRQFCLFSSYCLPTQYVSIGLPHFSSEEDVYDGYRIPKGSIVIANVWAMLHEEKIYTDPYIFNPDRYIRLADGQLDHDVIKPLAGFGFGRRVCPGKHMAFSATWIAVASILSVFNISKALDADGDIIEPSMEYDTSTLQNRPRPFKCSIKLRSPERLHVMQTDVDFVEGK